MFKKTLMAAALAAATGSAFAGEISVSGDAYQVGNEYLNSYTGSALKGDLDAASIGITYQAGIALGIDNTLKFVFDGGAISADTGLELQVASSATDLAPATETALKTAMDDAVDDVIAAGTSGDDDDDTDALIAAAVDTLTGTAYTSTTNAALVAIIEAVPFDTDIATTGAAVKAAYAAEDVKGGLSPVADLVDFVVDGNGDYTEVLFKLTAATLVTDVLAFNDTDATPNGSSNIVTTFTKATIGNDELTVSMPEAKDGTGEVLNAPIAGAETLVTTENQFDLKLTVAKDTIDVEQDRLFFVNNADDYTTTNEFGFKFNENGDIDLGISSAAAKFTVMIAGNTAGIKSIDFDDGTTDTTIDEDNGLVSTGLHDGVITIDVDGETNLATRTLTYSLSVTPDEEYTEEFSMQGSTTAFVWGLNGSEIIFPYAPVGFESLTTQFEVANSGTQEGDIIVSGFDQFGESHYATLDQKAIPGTVTKIGFNDLVEVFDLEEGTKLHLTITTTAPASDIKVTGYTNINGGGGRMTLLSDAYEK